MISEKHKDSSMTYFLWQWQSSLDSSPVALPTQQHTCRHGMAQSHLLN